MSEKETIDFEATLAKLEALVQEMESGDLSLEESLSKFEEGVNLTKQCQKALDSAKLRIEKLMPDGQLVSESDDSDDGSK